MFFFSIVSLCSKTCLCNEKLRYCTTNYHNIYPTLAYTKVGSVDGIKTLHASIVKCIFGTLFNHLTPTVKVEYNFHANAY